MKRIILASDEGSLAALIRKKTQEAKASMTGQAEEQMLQEVMDLINEAADQGKNSVRWARSNDYYESYGYERDAVLNVFKKLEEEGFSVHTERSFGRNGRGATIFWY